MMPADGPQVEHKQLHLSVFVWKTEIILSTHGIVWGPIQMVCLHCLALCTVNGHFYLYFLSYLTPQKRRANTCG